MERSNIAKILSKTQLFSGLTESHINDLLKPLTLHQHNFEKDNYVVHQGDVYSECLILLEGSFSAEITSPKGNVMRVEIIEAPDIIASGVLFSSSQILPVSLHALEDGTYLRLSKSNILSMMTKNQKLMENLASDMGNRITFLADKLRLMKFTNIKQKFLNYIHHLSQGGHRKSVSLPYSLEVLAELFSCARPTLSRVIGELQDQGIIEKKGREISILEMDIFMDAME